MAQPRFRDSFSYFEPEKFPNLSHENPYPAIVLQNPELFFLVVWENIQKIRSGGGGGSCVVVWDDRIGSVFLFFLGVLKVLAWVKEKAEQPKREKKWWEAVRWLSKFSGFGVLGS